MVWKEETRWPSSVDQMIELPGSEPTINFARVGDFAMAVDEKGGPNWINSEEAEKLGIDDASKEIKAMAGNQPVKITLTEEQMNALRRQWQGLDNGQPAELTFEVESQVTGKIRVAAYGYFSTTCCA